MAVSWLNLLTATLGGLTILLTIFIVVIFVKRSKQRLDIAFLLVLNTSVTLTIHSIVYIEVLLVPSAQLTIWCRLRAGYLMSTCSLSVALSYVLQAMYRLDRIRLMTASRPSRYWLTLIIVQWSVAFILCLPFLLGDGFIAHIAMGESYCVTTYRNMIASVYGSFTIYLIPVSTLTVLYGYVVFFLKSVQRGTTLQRHWQTQRDLTVIKRILFIVNGLVLAGLPPMALWLIYLINGNLIEPLIYQITWLSIQCGLLVENVLLIFFTTETRDVMRRKWRVRQI